MSSYTRRPKRDVAAASLVLLWSFAFSACRQPAPFEDDIWLARGANELEPVKKTLIAALSAGLAESPEVAVRACRIQAPAITRQFVSDSIRIGRTSHKLRNPENAAAPWLRIILEEYVADPEKASPVARRLDDQTVGYAEPILMKPLCVTCHGDSVEHDLQTEIQRLYPEDQAVGFQDGEFRGLFWVEFIGTDGSPEN